MTTPEFPDHASEWTGHRSVLGYVQNAAEQVGMQDRVHYRTLVERVKKDGDKWKVRTGTLTEANSGGSEDQAYKMVQRDWV